jgi:hypothetical protein
VTTATRMLALAFCLLFLGLGGLATGCESDTSPAPRGDNPPPPPSRTPTALRHGPNTFPMSNEMSEEEAKKLLKGEEEPAAEADAEANGEATEAEAPASE